MPLALSAVEQRDGRVEQEGLGPVRVRRSHRSFQVHEAEVGLLKDVAHVARRARPSPGAVVSPAAAAAARTGSCGNHVAGHGKAYLGQFVGIGNDDRWTGDCR